MIDRTVAAVAGVLCLVLIAFLLIQTGKMHNAERRADRAELTLSKERESAATQLAQLTQKARETEQTLTRQAEQIKEETHAQITALDARAADLRKRLRNAEANAATARLLPRAGTVAGAPEVAGVDHWPVIFGSLGEQLVSEAERADTVRLQLAACERQYEAAREALK